MRIKKYKGRLIYTGKKMNRMSIFRSRYNNFFTELWVGNNGKRINYSKLSTACKACKKHVEGE